MTLHPETAESLHLALTGKSAAIPNGDTPDDERELVRQVLAVESLSERLGVYNRMLHRRPDREAINLQVFEFKPKVAVQFIGREKEKEFKTADYIRTLNALGFDFRLCELDDQIQVNGDPLSDITESQINSAAHDVGLGKKRIMRDAYISESAKHRFNPVKDFLNSLEWNGQGWIETLAFHLRDEHELMPVLLRRWLIGAVARVYEPAQNRMLVLDGKQNIGKSFFVSWLASPLPTHFVEGGISPDDKDHHLRLVNTWIWEVSELGSTTRRSDMEALKSFLTMRNVTVRPPYGHHPIHKNVITSFVGTVNNIGGVLNDVTGSRRFMATTITAIDFAYTTIDIKQVWAEAVSLYRRGEPWKPLPAELDIINRINGTYEVQNPIVDFLYKYFDIDPENTMWFMPTLRIAELLHNNGWRGNTPTGEAMVIATACKKIGLRSGERWSKTTGKQNGYYGLSERV